ncbi:hypothetical protein L9F63_025798 [Diploptera punctata]|uniref:Uncharacterized protein n=1 Tax=Diploptera punctata TaxID=6984 RepID=A0AAD7Z7A0_DIPPU|nr:hypothetical protein L9F63_025798 [Diploptera punctata]
MIYTWKLRIIRRQEWSGNHAYQPDPLKIPVEYVIVEQTETEACLTETECTYSVRHIHTKHKGFGLYCIGFNFLIGGDGNVYEGRGWYRRGVYTGGYTTKAISIGFIGNFLEIEPVPNQVETAQQLIANGVKFGMISSDYKLITSQRETALQRMVSTWPHWSDEIIQ